MTIRRLSYSEKPLVMLWSISAIVGFGWMAKFDMTPNPATEIIDKWPTTTDLPKPLNEFALIMFVHPRCPCTRASLRELEKLIRHASSQIEACVVFVLPPSCSAGWEHGSLWNQTQDMNALACSDTDGMEAKRFGATVSGEVFVFDEGNRLRFHGAITRGRGHEGANAGINAIKSLLSAEQSERTEATLTETPLYGCPLLITLPATEAVQAANPCPCLTENN